MQDSSQSLSITEILILQIITVLRQIMLRLTMLSTADSLQARLSMITMLQEHSRHIMLRASIIKDSIIRADLHISSITDSRAVPTAAGRQR